MLSSLPNPSVNCRVHQCIAHFIVKRTQHIPRAPILPWLLIRQSSAVVLPWWISWPYQILACCSQEGEPLKVCSLDYISIVVHHLPDFLRILYKSPKSLLVANIEEVWWCSITIHYLDLLNWSPLCVYGGGGGSRNWTLVFCTFSPIFICFVPQDCWHFRLAMLNGAPISVACLQ